MMHKLLVSRIVFGTFIICFIEKKFFLIVFFGFTLISQQIFSDGLFQITPYIKF